MAITSANNIILQKSMAITSAIIKTKQKHNESMKLHGSPTCDTNMCWKFLRLTFSSDLEEAMFDTGESLSTIKN